MADLHEAYKVAAYLDLKVKSLEDVVSELSNGEDVKVVFKGYDAALETLERSFLDAAHKDQEDREQLGAVTEALSSNGLHDTSHLHATVHNASSEDGGSGGEGRDEEDSTSDNNEAPHDNAAQGDHELPEIPVPNQCGCCGKPAEGKCSICKAVKYCDRKCEKADRYVHRLMCETGPYRDPLRRRAILLPELGDYPEIIYIDAVPYA
ncbi:hypothetical protein LTR10_006773 [Elasticomyces elasticus]|nr:hypothetical protein LTR10_006773 [Elasticomyces elasticus]KAK4972826.1 hypothetical protein LTR42_006120 [Elasticomyces elasticus]